MPFNDFTTKAKESKTCVKTSLYRTRKLARQLRGLVLTDDTGLGLHTHTKQLTTPCNFNSRRSNALFSSPRAHAHTRYTYRQAGNTHT